MDCLNCSTGAMRAEPVQLEDTYRGKRFTVSMQGLKCPKCGYSTIEGTAMPEYMRRLADEYRRASRLLTSDEIKQRRSALGMSQEEFAIYLGNVGTASVKRWELGQVQDRAMNELIVLKTNINAAGRNWYHLSGAAHRGMGPMGPILGYPRQQAIYRDCFQQSPARRRAAAA